MGAFRDMESIGDKLKLKRDSFEIILTCPTQTNNGSDEESYPMQIDDHSRNRGRT